MGPGVASMLKRKRRSQVDVVRDILVSDDMLREITMRIPVSILRRRLRHRDYDFALLVEDVKVAKIEAKAEWSDKLADSVDTFTVRWPDRYVDHASVELGEVAWP